MKVDTEGKFLENIAAGLEAGLRQTAEGKRHGHFGMSAELPEELVGALQSASQTVEFLSHLCEGHFSPFQNLMRDQPM